MNPSSANDTAPGDLLTSFNGRSLKSIIVFTVVVHIILILGTSGTYLWRMVTGPDTSNMSETERMDLAVKEASSAMRRIAEQHGLKPQDLGSQFAAPAGAAKPVAPKATPGPKPAAEAPAEAKTPAPVPSPAAPEPPKSAIEKEINQAVPGPTVPADDDLFK